MLFATKKDLVNKVLAENIHGNLKHDLKVKVQELIEPMIEEIVNDTVADLVTRIETFNDMDGTVQVRVMFTKGS